jgi:hypothetical protein
MSAQHTPGLVIPELEPHCGSWVVSRKAGGAVIGEFFARSTVERFNPTTCRVETTAQYLARIKNAARATGSAS